jgi:hypothetical protein
MLKITAEDMEAGRPCSQADYEMGKQEMPPVKP